MWEKNEDGMEVRRRSCLVPCSVLSAMRWIGGLCTQPLDAILPHAVKDEFPWQSNLISA